MRSDLNSSRIETLAADVGFRGRSLLSINDLTDKQILELFELGKRLEPWNMLGIGLLAGRVMVTLFFQPSTRTRMSFETAMLRLGGGVVTETTPLISSSAAKEESLNDTMKVVSKYANVVVLRHPEEEVARVASAYSEVPVINGGFGNWEHPTQALLDLYTLWRTFGRVEGLKVCVASPDLIAARTGHSMAMGLSRLGASVTLASRKDRRIPAEVRSMLKDGVEEVFDLDQDGFNRTR